MVSVVETYMKTELPYSEVANKKMQKLQTRKNVKTSFHEIYKKKKRKQIFTK